MQRFFARLFSRMPAVLLGLCLANGFAADAGKPHYVVTNDDVPPRNPTSVTFYTVNAGGLLTMKKKVLTGGIGIAGGYFAANRVNVLESGNAECIYASQATSGDIVGVVCAHPDCWWQRARLDERRRKIQRHRFSHELAIPVCQLHRLQATSEPFRCCPVAK